MGDDKSFLVGSYHLSKFEVFTPEEKWNYFYFHIHKPLIVTLTAALHWLDLSYYWFAIPFAFSLIGGIFLFLFLKDKIENRIILFGSVLILLFNSVWFYLGNRLLPDIPLAATLIVLVYALDKSIRPTGEFSRNHWYLTALIAAAATLFRVETFPVFLVPIAYYVYIRYCKNGKPVVSCLKEALADKNIWHFILIFLLTITIFFAAYIYLIEKTTNILDYPGIFFEQLSKVRDATAAIGANKGNALFVLSELILSFTILLFILSLCGLYSIIRDKKKIFYPSVLLFVGLIIENTLLTFFYSGEQRYVTRLFPFLVIFLAKFADDLLKDRHLEGGQLRMIASISLIAMLVYSSYFLVHRGFGPDDQILGYENKMLGVRGPALDSLANDDLASAQDGYWGYFAIRRAISEYGRDSYDRIFINLDSEKYAEYIWIIDKKETLSIINANASTFNETALQQIRRSDLIITVSFRDFSSNIPHIKSMFYAPLGLHIYVSKPEQLFSFPG